MLKSQNRYLISSLYFSGEYLAEIDVKSGRVVTDTFFMEKNIKGMNIATLKKEYPYLGEFIEMSANEFTVYKRLNLTTIPFVITEEEFENKIGMGMPNKWKGRNGWESFHTKETLMHDLVWWYGCNKKGECIKFLESPIIDDKKLTDKLTYAQNAIALFLAIKKNKIVT